MAHEINFNEITGKHSFYARSEKAWHGLGQVKDGYQNSREVIVDAGLDYTVNIAPNTHHVPGFESVVADDSFYTYRTDNGAILGSRIGKKYRVLQNVDAFGFFDAITEGEGILYETAGALGKGERIFITAKLPDYIKVAQDDLIEKYIFLYNSHDGTGSIKIAFTPVRIVCANTLNAAMRNCQNSIEIRHTESAAEKLRKAHTFLGISNQFSAQFEQLMQSWVKVPMTDPQVKRLIEMALCPNKETLTKLQAGQWEEVSTRFKNSVDAAFEYAMCNVTQQMGTTRGTLFGAYNAVTGYFQNVKEYKNTSAKFESIIEGSAFQKGQAAFNMCVNFADLGETALIYN
ncbi:DUF932 domain-containing protein [Chitinophaga arvensicola]|uniref:Phage/plasmid-like protein TIGR03299 n=1 Tax=Chitinophaga arvensicola TaxID=29529 RepID=A0A1I0PQS7_9BACT|nr:DUF932 domain-containing protein [Chitinophaga arvensicola]SEW16653.1 phage/plasmid-like protein TIGR03299 [Chitinophaga arvensicola]